MPIPLNTAQLSVLLAAMIGIIPFSLDAYLPAMPLMADHLGVNLHQIELTISSFLFGYALGSLFGGPLSDHYGRRLMGSLGLFIFMLVSLAITQAESYQSLLVLRFFQALSGGVTTVVVPAVVRDRYPRQEAAKVMSTIAFIMLAAPLLAPVVGTGIFTLWGWHAIFLFLAAYAAVLVTCAHLYLPESRDKSLTPPAFSLREILRNYRHVLAHTQARPYFIAIVMCNAIFLSYITQVPFLLNEYMGLSTVQFPMVFAGFVMCLMLANRCNAYLLNRYSAQLVFLWGIRLTIASTVVLLLAALFGGASSLWVMAGVLLVISSLGLVNSNAQANYLHYFGEHSGTATSVMRASQLTAGGLSGALVSALYNGTPVPLATVMFAAAGIALFATRKLDTKTDEATECTA